MLGTHSSVAALVYSAAKAGLWSFSKTLREQLKATSIEVIEFAPPHVETDLDAPGANSAGMPLHKFVDAAVVELVAGVPVVTVAFSKAAHHSSRDEREVLFAKLNGPH
ncbi:MAG: SDR family NAD(P)-dependent oxidoreductase [Clostridia bacterium]|nr:SDR family NAD(P)-dependent oxidoreductase [Deltaproteobacteria bacterium]